MVSLKQFEGENAFVKPNAGSEQSKCQQMPHRGIKTHIYWLASTAKGNFAADDEDQSLLDALLLSQWEERSWKGQLAYDVTMCETKIIMGGMKLMAQLNEKWNANFIVDFENDVLEPLEPPKSGHMKIIRENLLFCIASAEKEDSELIPSTALPKDGILVMVNVNPVEYGHVFLVPYDITQRSQLLDKKILDLISQFAKEINSYSFRIFFDHKSSAHADHLYFQAGYFANPLPVELLPTVLIYGGLDNEGVNICEIADYPLKALVFTGPYSELLFGLVAEICSILMANDVVFNLLVSDCATKVFLFPQVPLPTAGGHLSTWECGGYFVYKTKAEFDNAYEADLSKRLAAASLDDKGFQALKQLCRSAAIKLQSDMMQA